MERILIAMFDARMKTFTDRRGYRIFLRKLIGEGFTPIQKSVYLKKVANSTAQNLQITHVKKFTPSNIKVYIISLSQSVFDGIVNINCDIIKTDLPNIICV